MAKKRQPRRVMRRATFSCSMLSIEINGEKVEVPPVRYERVEYADGRVEETGRPPGVPEGATAGEVIGHVLRQIGGGGGS